MGRGVNDRCFECLKWSKREEVEKNGKDEEQEEKKERR